MHDAKASHLEQPNGIDLTEFLAPRVGVFPGISDHCDVAKLVGARLAQDGGVRRPRHRASLGYTAIVVVMWVGDENRVGTYAWREIVSEPNAAGVWIDQNL